MASVFLILWAIAALLLVAFDLTTRAIAFAAVAFLAPFGFLLIRQAQRIAI